MGALAHLCFLLSLGLFLCSLFGEIPSPVNAENAWCVAKPSASDEELQENIEYACSQPGVDCGPIAQGGPCFGPNTRAHHASFAMNSFYQNKGRLNYTCSFSNSGLIAATDPSYGNCTYGGGDTPLEKLRTWCVAKAGVDEASLKLNIDYVCSRIDCKDIQQGNPCFNPNTVLSHASFAMNLFYHTQGQGQDCDFKNTGLIVVTDPSYGMCTYI